jgi:mono/diheme cytochrome c family protein
VCVFALVGLTGSAIALAQQQSGPAAQSRTARAAAPARTPTFAKDVAPILYKNCVTCHRPGEVAPMSLISYADVRPWARAINQKISNGVMPPWFADAPRGRFTNDNRLTQEEVATVARWVAAGAPQGDAADMPKLPAFAEGWQMGTPDYVFEMPVEFEIPASGTIEYQTFETPVPFKETMWVQAVEARAGDPEHVHHLTAQVVEPEDAPRRTNAVVTGGSTQTAEQRAAAEQAARRQGVPFVTQARGEGPHIFPLGTAKRILPGSTIKWSLHYTTNGRPGKDRSKIGVIFSKTPPEHEMLHAFVSNPTFVIPPGVDNHKVEADATFSEDVELWSMHPHMHYRGKSQTATLTYPDGRTEVILNVPRYDSGWQVEYQLREPLHVPKGSTLHVTSYFDNSTANRFNPDPNATVRWGDQTWEEMMILDAHYTVNKKAATTATGGQQ